jgi:hypothetical protein
MVKPCASISASVQPSQFERASAVRLGGHGDGGEGEAWSQWRRVDRVGDLLPRHARQGGPPVLFRAVSQPQRNRLVGGAEHSVHALEW